MFRPTVVALWALVWVAAPKASPWGGDVPIDYRCDHMTLRRLEDGGHELRCSGAAIFRRDNALLCCEEAIGRADAHWSWQSGTCRGQVRLSRGEESIWADRAEFVLKRSELTLFGRPLLQRGGSRMAGTKMTVTTRNDAAQIDEPQGSVWLPGASAPSAPTPKAAWQSGPLPARCPLPARPSTP